MNGEAFRGKFDELRTIGVSLSRLEPDSPRTCRIPWEHIIEHANTEADDGSGAQLSNPIFLRTARIGETSYWIWNFHDPRRGDGYVTALLWPDGRTIIDADDTFDMTPEQYLVALHFQIEP